MKFWSWGLEGVVVEVQFSVEDNLTELQSGRFSFAQITKALLESYIEDDASWMKPITFLQLLLGISRLGFLVGFYNAFVLVWARVRKFGVLTRRIVELEAQPQLLDRTQARKATRFSRKQSSNWYWIKPHSSELRERGGERVSDWVRDSDGEKKRGKNVMIATFGQFSQQEPKSSNLIEL